MGRGWAAAPREHWLAQGTPERQNTEARAREEAVPRPPEREVVFIGRGLDRAALEQAWKAMQPSDAELGMG